MAGSLRYSDWALIAGTLVSIATAVVLAAANAAPGGAAAASTAGAETAAAAEGFPPTTVLRASLIAFGCAAIAVTVDLNSSVRRQLGPIADTFVLAKWQDIATHATFCTDLEARMKAIVQGKQNEVKLKLGAEIASLRNAYGQGADETARDTALNGNRRARCALVSVGIDYRGVAELTSWATENKYLT